MMSQDLSEFDLHARAILGLPIPEIKYYEPSATAVVLADKTSKTYSFTGVEKALKVKGVAVRLFGKPDTRKHRRMAITLARGKNIKEARKKALKASTKIKIKY